jgi:class 3 adenylate cyclase/predicted ATPase
MKGPAIASDESTIGLWLDSLELGKYRSLFAEHAIDFEILRELTEQDLIGMAIPLGHRKKILRGIAALDYVADRPGVPAPARQRADRTERRQVTILFCDLVDSTALANRLDPEDLRGVINTCLETCTAAVNRFEGQVARLMGDGLMAYFGYPYAREDAAECAVRAALDSIEAVHRLDLLPGYLLRIHAGVATGLVVVGDLIGEGAAREETVVGTTPAMASRLSAFALPGTVLVDPGTRRLLGDRFELESLGPHQFKGMATETPVWQVLRVAQVATRFDAAHKTRLLDFVGREDEIALLQSRWQMAANGQGQAVLVSGEAGIGKSRICIQLHERLAETPHTLVRLQCSPYHVNSALYPVIAQLMGVAGLRSEQPACEKRERLAALLNETGSDPGDDLVLIETLLSVSPEGSAPEWSGRELKRRILDLLVRRLLMLARRRPVLWLVEDVHWIDPTTLELLNLCIDRLSNVRVLALITFRPDFRQNWTNQGHVTTLNLSRLERCHTADLVGQVTGGKKLPPEVFDSILARTDGIPLFTEELTRTILESGGLEERPIEYVLGETIPSLPIPETLQGSLLARLDRLATAKEVAQLAAAIGREFNYELIAAVEPVPGASLTDALRQLADAGLILVQGTPPSASYSFKHALVRDATYSTLLHSRRYVLHARIASVLHERFPEIAASQPELIAHHYTAGGLNKQAVTWWLRAGQRAVHRSANAEAIAHLSQARQMLSALGEEDRTEHELEVETLLGQATTELRGYAAPQTLAVWQRARGLLGPHSDSSRKFAVLYGLWAAAYVTGQPDLQRQVASEALTEAETRGDAAGLCLANRILGTTLVVSGELYRGRYHLEQARALYDAQRHRPLMFQFGQDIGATAMSHLCLALYHLGLIDQALAMADKAIRHARALNHPHTLAYTLAHVRVCLDACRGSTENNAVYTELLALSRKHRFRFWRAIAMMYDSWAAICQDEIEQPLAQFQRALEGTRQAGSFNWISLFQALYAQALAKTGDMERALTLSDEAIFIGRTHGEVFALPEVLRLKARLLASVGHSDEARTCLAEALKLAREQGALCFELRVAVDLARIASERSEMDAALARIRGAYEKFTEGHTRQELIAARSVLGKLEERSGVHS